MIAATPGAVGISRWLAPELINPSRKKGYRQPAGTGQADIFAFAILVVEVVTGELSFGSVSYSDDRPRTETRETSRRRKRWPCYRNMEVHSAMLAPKTHKKTPH